MANNLHNEVSIEVPAAMRLKIAMAKRDQLQAEAYEASLNATIAEGAGAPKGQVDGLRKQARDQFTMARMCGEEIKSIEAEQAA
jgi:hypothetical protein